MNGPLIELKLNTATHELFVGEKVFHCDVLIVDGVRIDLSAFSRLTNPRRDALYSITRDGDTLVFSFASVLAEDGSVMPEKVLDAAQFFADKLDGGPRAPEPEFEFNYLEPADRPVIDGLEHHEIIFAKDQPEYIPLRVLRGNTREVPVLSRWALTAAQRKAVSDGADIFLELSTFNGPLQPIRLALSRRPNPDFFREQFMLAEPKAGD